MSAISVKQEECIIAPATANGVGAIAVLRLSGENAIRIANNVFKGKDLNAAKSHTLHFGKLMDGDIEIDEVLISIFKSPNSYTLEDVVEISSHGSPYIVDRIVQLFIKNGVRLAKAGEFTKRAFLNGRFDLAQAEAVADLISSESEAEHKLAMNQMRGGFSKEIKALRDELVHFASMIELELDFSEEDVEFADRSQLVNLIQRIQTVIKGLLDSFKYGRVLKQGIPVAIVGKPNSGKSTLMNLLLKEDKAIVTDIPGTTRDFIEDIFVLDGIKFRIIDTAGIRETEDVVESAGVKRSIEQLSKASIGLYLFDASSTNAQALNEEIDSTTEKLKADLDKEIPKIIPIANKIDQGKKEDLDSVKDIHFISAKTGDGLEQLHKVLRKHAEESAGNSDITITNNRHFESLSRTYESLDQVLNALASQIPSDLIAQDIRYALHQLGEITGEITTDDLLKNIFSKFCIGK